MFVVYAWNIEVQEYWSVFRGTREECEDWARMRKFVGDKRTFLIREGSSV